MTVLLVEQNAAVALDVADHAYVLENGRIVLDGTPDDCASTLISASSTSAAASGSAAIATSSNTAGSRRWYG